MLGVDKASQLVDLPDDRLPELAEMAQGFGRAELNRVAEMRISDALSELRGATAPRLHLELLMSEVCLPTGATDSLEAVFAHLDRLERRMEGTVRAVRRRRRRGPGTAVASRTPSRTAC